MITGSLAVENEEEISPETSSIPIRNLWLLLLYASELFKEIHERGVDVEANPDDIPDLVAEILAHHVDRRLRRNLTYGYLSREEILSRVRGRIDLLKTEHHRLLDRGQVACRFEELSVDTPRNRHVRSALELLAAMVKRRDLAHRCRSLAESLRRMGVLGERPSRSQLSKDKIGLADAADRDMVVAANLAFDLALPTESEGRCHLGKHDRDVVWLRRLFERAVGGFYDSVLPSDWKVMRGKWIGWQVEESSADAFNLLPSMQLDIQLCNTQLQRQITIDTKFNSILTKARHGNESFRSGYIYQLYSYLRSQENADEASQRASGVLLHPSIGRDIDEWVSIQGHKLRFATVDLEVRAVNIRRKLLEIVGVEE